MISLIVIIVTLFILTGVSAFSGMESAEKTALQGFYTQMDIVQKRVDDIAQTNESFIMNNNGSEIVIKLKEQGNSLTNDQTTLLTSILNLENINAQPSSFKYFTVDDLEEKLDIPNIQYDVFIDFDNRIVVAEDGVTVGNKTYYVSNTKTYFVEHNNINNELIVEELNYTVAQYGESKYKVIVNPVNTKGQLLKDGYIKYKKTTTKYWETSLNTDIILELNVLYNIKYVDDNNSFEKTIKVEFVENEQGISNLTVIEATD